jgi:hypothetical protein
MVCGQDTTHDGFIEIGVRQESNLYDRRVACISSRARMSPSFDLPVRVQEHPGGNISYVAICRRLEPGGTICFRPSPWATGTKN